MQSVYSKSENNVFHHSRWVECDQSVECDLLPKICQSVTHWVPPCHYHWCGSVCTTTTTTTRTSLLNLKFSFYQKRWRKVDIKHPLCQAWDVKRKVISLWYLLHRKGKVLFFAPCHSFDKLWFWSQTNFQRSKSTSSFSQHIPNKHYTRLWLTFWGHDAYALWLEMIVVLVHLHVEPGYLVILHPTIRSSLKLRKKS